MRTIVLTGVTRGLGLAMLEGFIGAGHRVAGCGRSVGVIEQLAGQYPEQHFRVVDVSHEGAVRAWAGEVLERFGVPDLLVNNAAVINSNRRLWEVGADEFHRVMVVNVCGTANVIRHFMPAMVRRGVGVVVNFSSGWGRSTSPEVAPYCASKWAIEGLTQSLAQELPRGMAAVALNPGVIDTDMLRSCFGAEAGAYCGAAEWAESAVPFVLSLGARHNGQSLSVPGGA